MKCECACTGAGKYDSSARPYFDQNMNCVCTVCIYQCSVVYYIHGETRLDIQAKEEYLAVINKKPQSKIDSFFGFTDAIADLAKDRIKNTDSLSTANALGLTSEDLLQSIKLQENTDLRNSLQQKIGSIEVGSPIKFGNTTKSLAELRREARIKRFVSPHKKNSHLPIECEEISVVTPASPLGSNDNSRWYRNNLSANPIVDIDQDASTSPTATSFKVTNLKKAVMKRLLSVNSPPSKTKRLCFRKLNDNDPAANTVIDLAVEMESSIQETTVMVMNNCVD